MTGDAHDFNKIERQAVIKSFCSSRQGAEGNSRHSDRNITGTCTIVRHRQKLGGQVLNVVIFPPVLRLVLDEPKQ